MDQPFDPPRSFDPANPLAKIPGESPRANQALRDYFAMGGGRSLRGLLESYSQQTDTKPPTRRLKTLADWSTNLGWVARVEAQNALDLEADKVLWAERRAQIREADWTQGLALRDLANKLLGESTNFIKTRRRVVKGRPMRVGANGEVLDPGEPDQVIVTMALDGPFMVKAAVTGSELTRLAAELETSRESVNLAGSVVVQREIDYADLSDSQLEKLANDTARLLMAVTNRKGPGVQPVPIEGQDSTSTGPGDPDP